MVNTDQTAALVLFSGGQDSATCLAWALDRFGRVETVGFHYGQRHEVEMACRRDVRAAISADFPEWTERLGPDHVLDLSVIGEVSETALTREAEIRLSRDGLPTTFVPGRNLAFLVFAGMVAYRIDAPHIVAGMCETDFSGYPDCRDETVKAMNAALNLGMARAFEIHTPLMWIDKAETWRMAESLGGPTLVDLIVERTHTCYLGERDKRHDWGYGCGTCPACELRARGWERYTGS